MKTVIEMAIEAELIYNEEGWCGWVEDTDLRPFIERFAELVRAEEREACAKVCDVTVIGDEYLTAVLNTYADTIRSRSSEH